uniref:Aminotransferase class I/classII large domain-containing protein n=1 Tax=Calcidiscus leptoporus TaxID=127549 RepID=A0A7S0JGZ5_9EUKA|mmetsp:Transcript_57862/g.132913  ORF Transcript_57862/g.132913 Transcript_57862/m.132913 type:complete len:537 (+) Transcript_57862:105-1715(+)
MICHLGVAATGLFLLTIQIAAPAAVRENLGLTADNINPRVVAAEYAVRGRLLDRAVELEALGRTVVRCNIGNPQALGQTPLTWVRQVLSLCVNPELLEAAEAAHADHVEGTEKTGLAALFAEDAVTRARKYMHAVRSVGAYSDSQGVLVVREEVADFLRERDGCEIDSGDIFLVDGASAGVRTLMQCLIGEPGVDAILAPSPVYPLYSALTTLLDGATALYPLAESYETGVWTVRLTDLERSLDEARSKGVNVRAVVVINPGNPTGQCMSNSEVRAVLEFAAREGLVVLADEVYQENVYNAPGTSRLAHSSNQFISFRRVLVQMRVDDPVLAARVQLVSMHSTSKGYVGECGLRGGFFALNGNWDAAVKAQLVKLASVCLCSNLVGQLAMGLIVRPPRAGEPSHALFSTQRSTILESLRKRADKLAVALDSLEGVTCAPAEGALYLFPRIELPIKAIAKAREVGLPPDEFYALKLLDATGLVVVPGSGFGQPDPYAFHVRTTFLPPISQLDGVVDDITRFHNSFMDEYSMMRPERM